MLCAPCSVHLALCSLHCAPCSVLLALCSLLCAPCSVLLALCAFLCAPCSVLLALCSLLLALCSLLCALCSLLCAPCSVHLALCALNYVLALCSCSMILLYVPALCSCSTLLLFDSCSLRREPEESLTTHTPPVRLGLGTNLLTAELLTGVILEVPYNELCAGRKQSMYFQHSVRLAK